MVEQATQRGLLVLCIMLCIAATTWFMISSMTSDYHCHKMTPNDLTAIKISTKSKQMGGMKQTWTLNKINPINTNHRHQSIEPPLTVSLARADKTLFISYPTIDTLGNEYWDVSFQGPWFDYSSMLVKHWQATLPHGIEPVYDYRQPKIFFHGRWSNPYKQFQRQGYLTDDFHRKQLWTVALTNKMYAIKWIFTESSDISLISGVGYVVVFKLRHQNNKKCKLKQMEWGDKRWTSSTDYIKARYNFYHPNKICEASKYPDAYVFSEKAQKGNCPLDIARVYRIFFHR